jgi:type IV secretory pathway VirB2 component (pilin)
MNDQAGTITQIISVVLIVMGLAAIAGADHFNMRDLANAGTVVVGAGVGLLTGKTLKNKESNS